MAQEVGIGAPRIQQLSRYRVHFGEAVVADDDPKLFVGVGQGARHVVEGRVKLGLLSRQFFLGALESGDVRDHSHRAARCRPTAIDFVNAAVGRTVFESLARRIPQAFHSLRDKGIDVTFSVVSVLGQITK